MNEGQGVSSRKSGRKMAWRRAIAISLIALGFLSLALAASYLIYGQVAKSRLDDLVYPLPTQVAPTPTGPEVVAAIDPGKMSLYPGSQLNPKYWSAPLWAGSDPIPASGLPAGFTPIDTATTARLHSLPAATGIKIPLIEVDSTVKDLEVVNLKDSRSYETPKWTVGHIPETGNPGEAGRGWFFGHLESPIRGEGNVFKDLPKIPKLLREGNRVFIILDSEKASYLYEVVSTDLLYQDDLVVRKDNDAAITLVTCVPAITYDYRLLVNAKLVGLKNSG